MSGPYCGSCIHFHPAMLGDKNQGECMDPTKVIEGPAGDDWNQPPPVYIRCSCRNHETKQPSGADEHG